MNFARIWRMPINFLVVVILLLPTLHAMAGSGSDSYQNECMGCHVSQTNNASSVGPPLGGLSKQYILRQLKGFKYGWRGAGDPTAQSMSEAVEKYSDEELGAIAEWASNIKSNRKFENSREKGGEGYQLYQDRCKGCHESGIGRFMTGSPNLKYLDADYIVRQLQFFDKGHRGFDQPTKHQLKMQSVVRSLTDDEFEMLSRFITNASLITDEDLDE